MERDPDQTDPNEELRALLRAIGGDDPGPAIAQFVGTVVRRHAHALVAAGQAAGSSAEDAVQDALVTFATRLHETEFRNRVTEGRPYAFLVVMVRNRAIDWQRRGVTRLRVQTAVKDESDDETTVPELARRDVERLLAVLSPADQLLTWRFFGEGWTSAELADELGMTPAAVRQRARRALRTIRDALEGGNDERKYDGE